MLNLYPNKGTLRVGTQTLLKSARGSSSLLPALTLNKASSSKKGNHPYLPKKLPHLQPQPYCIGSVSLGFLLCCCEASNTESGTWYFVNKCFIYKALPCSKSKFSYILESPSRHYLVSQYILSIHYIESSMEETNKKNQNSFFPPRDCDIAGHLDISEFQNGIRSQANTIMSEGG